ncbi:hypothetical protein WJX72_007293 [[Myrmecia] bisecta]|uniref:Protein kinase domain-containing protein n=1 Tax=[Myrmecia] bisecta TaxID=41462 RepID=A0AAW1R7Y1_9CHLO
MADDVAKSHLTTAVAKRPPDYAQLASTEDALADAGIDIEQGYLALGRLPRTLKSGYALLGEAMEYYNESVSPGSSTHRDPIKPYHPHSVKYWTDWREQGSGTEPGVVAAVRRNVALPINDILDRSDSWHEYEWQQDATSTPSVSALAAQATLVADQEFERFLTSTNIQRDIEDEAAGRAKHTTPAYALTKVHDAGAQVVKALLKLKRRARGPQTADAAGAPKAHEAWSTPGHKHHRYFEDIASQLVRYAFYRTEGCERAGIALSDFDGIVGSGVTGTAYRCRMLGGVTAAAKLAPCGSRKAAALAHEAEAYQAASCIQGRYVPRLLAAGVGMDGWCYMLATGLVAGRPLDPRRHWEDRALAPHAQEALAALHDAGVLHNDIRLDNMLVLEEPGAGATRVMFIDLHLAVLGAPESELQNEKDYLAGLIA